MSKTIYLNRDGTTSAVTVIMKKLMTLLFFLSLSLQSYSAQMIKTTIFDLEVTQKCVGFLEVQEKVKKIEKLSDEERKVYLKQEPIPVVIGPQGKMYMVDHHHLARAIYESGHKTVYVEPFLDLSHLNIKEFWQEMIAKKYTYLKDNGVDITPADLPKSIEFTTDDVYRSLAGQVRKGGGFSKTTIPFAEFQWADFFRTRIKIKPGKIGYQDAIQEAITLAKTDQAKGLPGHISNQNTAPSCATVL